MKYAAFLNLRARGFTMIELVAVIAIVGLLTSVVMVMIGNARAKGRDARREHDIKELENALSVYVTNARTFPVCPTEAIVDGMSDCLSAALRSANAMDAVPTDPLGSAGACGGAGNYAYCYQSSAKGQTYTIRYALEISNVQDKSPGWHSVSP